MWLFARAIGTLEAGVRDIPSHENEMMNVKGTLSEIEVIEG